MLKKMLSCGAAASVVVLAAALNPGVAKAAAPLARSTTALTAATMRPLNSGQHCNSQVCIQVTSAGGSGPDVQNAAVETNGAWDLAPGTAVSVQYGPNPGAAHRRPALEMQRTSGGGTVGFNFAVYRTLRPGWVLCGRIQGVSGYPCVTIGR